MVRIGKYIQAMIGNVHNKLLGAGKFWTAQVKGLITQTITENLTKILLKASHIFKDLLFPGLNFKNS